MKNKIYPFYFSIGAIVLYSLFYGYSGIDGYLFVFYGLEQVFIGNKFHRLLKFCVDLFQTELLAQHQ